MPQWVDPLDPWSLSPEQSELHKSCTISFVFDYESYASMSLSHHLRAKKMTTMKMPRIVQAAHRMASGQPPFDL